MCVAVNFVKGEDESVFGVLIGFLPEGKLGELLLLGLCAALGVVVYAIAVTVMGLSEAKLAWDLLKRKGKRG